MRFLSILLNMIYPYLSSPRDIPVDSTGTQTSNPQTTTTKVILQTQERIEYMRHFSQSHCDVTYPATSHGNIAYESLGLLLRARNIITTSYGRLNGSGIYNYFEFFPWILESQTVLIAFSVRYLAPNYCVRDIVHVNCGFRLS
jgi:hypothetical protein